MVTKIIGGITKTIGTFTKIIGGITKIIVMITKIIGGVTNIIVMVTKIIGGNSEGLTQCNCSKQKEKLKVKPSLYFKGSITEQLCS